MKLPAWFREELPETASAFRMSMSMLRLMWALMVVLGIWEGETEPELAYPMLAFVSSGLLGIGFVRPGSVNLPAILGTLVAVGAASYWLSQELPPYFAAETWTKLTAFVVMLGTLTTITVGALLTRFPLAAQRAGDSSFGGVCLRLLFLFTGLGIPCAYFFLIAYLLR